MHIPAVQAGFQDYRDQSKPARIVFKEKFGMLADVLIQRTGSGNHDSESFAPFFCLPFRIADGVAGNGAGIAIDEHCVRPQYRSPVPKRWWRLQSGAFPHAGHVQPYAGDFLLICPHPVNSYGSNSFSRTLSCR